MTWVGLTVEQRRMVRRLSAEGLSLRQVARQVSCSHQTAWLVLRGNGGPVGEVGVGTGRGSSLRGGAGRDQSRGAPGRDVRRDRIPSGSGDFHGEPGDGLQRWPGRVSGVAGP